MNKQLIISALRCRYISPNRHHRVFIPEKSDLKVPLKYLHHIISYFNNKYHMTNIGRRSFVKEQYTFISNILTTNIDSNTVLTILHDVVTCRTPEKIIIQHVGLKNEEYLELFQDTNWKIITKWTPHAHLIFEKYVIFINEIKITIVVLYNNPYIVQDSSGNYYVEIPNIQQSLNTTPIPSLVE